MDAGGCRCSRLPGFQGLERVKQSIFGDFCTRQPTENICWLKWFCRLFHTFLITLPEWMPSLTKIRHTREQTTKTARAYTMKPCHAVTIGTRDSVQHAAGIIQHRRLTMRGRMRAAFAENRSQQATCFQFLGVTRAGNPLHSPVTTPAKSCKPLSSQVLRLLSALRTRRLRSLM
jgi:hypothetical protein